MGKISGKSKKKRRSLYIDSRKNNHSKEINLLIKQLEQFILVKQLEQVVKDRKNEFDHIKSELLHKAVDAGRAQLAAMILHNIGNAITPVAIYTEKLRNRNSTTSHYYLRKCYDELIENRERLTNYVNMDPRGIEVVDYMGSLIDTIESEHQKNCSVIEKIAIGIDYVAQILTLQKAYAPGKSEIREKINVNYLINDALKMQEYALSKRDISLKKNLVNSIPIILMEKNKLMQVIVNLIKNSCDAIDENRERPDHTLFIKTYYNETHIGFTISDTGTGVEANRVKEIFDFGTSSKGSSGFGLYYCKSFIESNRGTLKFESLGRGLGSTVTVEIPYVEPPEDRVENKDQ